MSKQTEPLSAVFADIKIHNSEQQGFCSWGGLVTPLLDSKEFLTEQRVYMSDIYTNEKKKKSLLGTCKSYFFYQIREEDLNWSRVR